MSQELVLNGAYWSDTGLPVEDVALEGPGGFVVNVQSTDEPPLQLGRCVCNAGEGVHSFDTTEVGRPSIFGSPPRAEDVNADTYGDAAEMQRRRGQLRADLGLTTEENPERARSTTRQQVDVAPVPGFPLRSRLADTE